MTYYPDRPTKADLKQDELIRNAELGRINDIVYPFAAYHRAALNLTMNIRQTYGARNPLTALDRQRRHVIAMYADLDKKKELPFNWKSSAKGQAILGISGSGKTTFADAFSIPYQVVIEHQKYGEHGLQCLQVPWIKVRVPHDATLKSLCLQFFAVVDSILENTAYEKQAESVRGVARMANLMSAVSNTISLGTLFIDEVQNLKSAKSTQAHIVLNLFSEIIERAGVNVIIAGTPAVEQVFSRNVRNIRKLSSGGPTRLFAMDAKDPEWAGYTEVYWDYQFVKKPGRLTQSIRDAWHRASGGNAAFAALAFLLAQRFEIGGREVIDEISFERVVRTDMAILGPAIDALLSKDKNKLLLFDDLLFKEGIMALRDDIEWSGAEEAPADQSELHEIEELQQEEELEQKRAVAPPAPSKAVSKRRPKAPEMARALPLEHPLKR